MRASDVGGLSGGEGRPHLGKDTLDPMVLGAPLSVADAVALGQRLCAEVGRLHRAGVVHGWIEPRHVRVPRAGGVSTAVLLRSRPVEPLCAESAPERFEGLEPTAASDVYGLCISLYVALTGTRPLLGASDEETATWVRKMPLEPLREVRPELEAHPLLAAALAEGTSKDPAKRPPFERLAAVLASEASSLARAASRRSTSAPPPPPPPQGGARQSAKNAAATSAAPRSGFPCPRTTPPPPPRTRLEAATSRTATPARPFEPGSVAAPLPSEARAAPPRGERPASPPPPPAAATRPRPSSAPPAAPPQSATRGGPAPKTTPEAMPSDLPPRGSSSAAPGAARISVTAPSTPTSSAARSHRRSPPPRPTPAAKASATRASTAPPAPARTDAKAADPEAPSPRRSSSPPRPEPAAKASAARASTPPPAPARTAAKPADPEAPSPRRSSSPPRPEPAAKAPAARASTAPPAPEKTAEKDADPDKAPAPRRSSPPPRPTPATKATAARASTAPPAPEKTYAQDAAVEGPAPHRGPAQPRPPSPRPAEADCSNGFIPPEAGIQTVEPAREPLAPPLRGGDYDETDRPRSVEETPRPEPVRDLSPSDASTTPAARRSSVPPAPEPGVVATVIVRACEPEDEPLLLTKPKGRAEPGVGLESTRESLAALRQRLRAGRITAETTSPRRPEPPPEPRAEGRGEEPSPPRERAVVVEAPRAAREGHTGVTAKFLRDGLMLERAAEQDLVDEAGDRREHLVAWLRLVALGVVVSALLAASYIGLTWSN